MALKDLIEEALLVAASDEARRTTLTDVLHQAGSGTDAEILTALSKIITEREQQAGSYSLAGQTDLSAREHEEINALREFLRKAAASTPKSAKTEKKLVAKPVAHDTEPTKPVISKLQIGLIAGALVVVAAAVGAYFWLGHGSEEATSLDSGVPTANLHYADDMALGNPKAPIQIVEYAAPACPHCANFNATAIPNLKREYIDTGKVYYIFRVFPIMPADGAIEAIARTCMPKDKYFQYIDLMFRNQDKWDPENGITDVRAGIIQVGRIAGLSPEQIDKCMADPTALARVNRMSDEAQKKYDLHGVPDIIINGTLWRTGGTSWQELKEKLESMLAKK